MATLTIAILTLNEAKRIGACVQSARFADQVLVIDGGRARFVRVKPELARFIDFLARVPRTGRGCLPRE